MKVKYSATEVNAEELAEAYFAAHPRSPSAVRRPTLSPRSGMWMALSGRNAGDGVVGLGSTVEAALDAFDRRYLSALRPPPETG
jgi:hypothetical protein